MFKDLKTIVKLLIVVAFISACSFFGNIPYPKIEGRQLLPHERDQVLATLSSKIPNPNVQQVFLGRVLIEEADQRSRFRMVFIIQAPNQLKIELLPLQAAYPIATVVQQGARAYAISSVDKVYLETEQPERLLEKILGVRIAPMELGYAVLGKISSARVNTFEGEIYQSQTAIQFVPQDKLSFISFNDQFDLVYKEFRASYKTSRVVQLSRSSRDGLQVLNLSAPSQNFKMQIKITAKRVREPKSLLVEVPVGFRRIQL